MNNFYTQNFHISKIVLCICMKGNSGQRIHKNRPSHGLVLQLSGVQKYVFDQSVSMIVHPGDVFYLPKFSNYEVFMVELGDCIAINFDLYDTDLTFEPFSQKAQNIDRMRKHFEVFLRDWTLQKTGYLNACLGNLYHIIYAIQKKAASSYIASPVRALVDQAVEYIHQNISDPVFTVQDVADHLGISPEYFRRLFQAVYDISPRKYIIEVRLKKAGELILSNEFSISQISRMCGYENETYFSSEFKKAYGCSPSKYQGAM